MADTSKKSVGSEDLELIEIFEKKALFGALTEMLMYIRNPQYCAAKYSPKITLKPVYIKKESKDNRNQIGLFYSPFPKLDSFLLRENGEVA